MYLDNLPKITYNFPDGGFVELEMADIFRRVAFTEETRKNDSNFQLYTIKDGEKPDDVANRFYDDANLWWLILMFNNIIDVENEWPRSVSEVTKLTKNFLKGDSYFILETLDIQHNDVIVRRDIGEEASVDINNFGIIESYDPFLHKIDVKRSKGTISSNDEFYIFRGNTDTGYFQPSGFGFTSCAPQFIGSTGCAVILGPTSSDGYVGAGGWKYAEGQYCPTGGSTFGIIRKKTTIADGVSRFEYSSTETNPYSVINAGGVSGSFYSTTNICGLTSSILYKYIVDESSLPSYIDTITVFNNIHKTNDKNRIIKMLSPDIVRFVIEEFDSLLQGNSPPGTTKYVQLL